MEEDAIILKNVSKHFKLKVSILEKLSSNSFKKNKQVSALQDISFNIKKGEFVTIIGFNGSGKTTLLRTISGIYKPDSGFVKVNGILAPILHIGTGFHRELNAKENIIMSGMLLGFSKSKILSRVNHIIEFAELENFTEMKLKHYSSGMRARLAFSTVLQLDPDILLVDEILAVGDKRFKEKSFRAFSEFKKKQKTVLFVTHNLEKATKLSDRMILMHKGEILSIGEPEQVLNKYEELAKNFKK